MAQAGWRLVGFEIAATLPRRCDPLNRWRASVLLRSRAFGCVRFGGRQQAQPAHRRFWTAVCTPGKTYRL
jgi:hypothetical protein